MAQRSFDVVAPALEAHARTVAALAGELRAALNAAGMTAEAYGETGQRFATAMESLAQFGRETLRDGVDALDAAAAELRGTVTAYVQQDGQGGQRLAGLR